MVIEDNVLDILNSGRVEGNKFYMPQIPDRKLYLSVNKVLENLRGKWDKKAKAHVFTEDVEEKIIEAINTGQVEDIIGAKKLNQYFPTPKGIVEEMIEWACLEDKDIVLETSAGQGAIAEEIFKVTDKVILFEIDKDNIEALKKKRFSVNEVDFLSYTSPFDRKVDKVIQNPPFHLPGRAQADVDFCFHAWKFLKPGGIIVSIVSESPFFRENSKSREFRNWLLENNGESRKLDSGAFKESKTMVRTRMIKVVKN